MKPAFIHYQVSDYKVATPVYEGPLDLLLQLIERAELDITKLALSQVTDQYLAHLQNLEQVSRVHELIAKAIVHEDKP